MRSRIWIPILTVVMVNGCSNAEAQQKKEAVAGSASLEAAHEAFVLKDLPGMGHAIKEVMFSDAREEVKLNALNLLSQAYAEDCKFDFPVDWHLPGSIARMTVDQSRNIEPDGMWYKLKVAGHSKALDTVAQLRLLQFPDTVIVDKQAGIGEWSTEADLNDPTDFYFELSQKYTKESVKPGLFLLEIVTKDGEATNGWFILNDQFASSSPVLHTPAVGERLATRRPTFKWDDFKSPEYKSCEKRSMKIYVSKIPSDSWDLRWDYGSHDPSVTSATIGVDGTGELKESGRYWFSLFYREARNFGDLEIRRRSATSRHFYID